MNKLFSKIAALIAGLSLVIGVGFALASNRKQAPALAAGDDTKYALINSVDKLEAGSSYIITNGTSGSVKTMSSATNTNNRPTVNATITDGKITRGDSILSITLESSGSFWKIKTENYASTNNYFSQGNQTGNNYLKVVANGDDWSISFNGDAAVITSQLKSSRNIIRCNNSGTPISCYTSGQQPVYLFKEVATKALQSIAVETAPTKTTYAKGECFNPTGLVIRRNYDDESHDTFAYAGHSGSFNFSPNLTTPLQTSDTSISIKKKKKTTSQAILVREITAIALAGDMNDKDYIDGDDWDLAGLYLSITWNAGEPNPSTINLSDLTNGVDYLLDNDTAKKGLTSLTIIGEP